MIVLRIGFLFQSQGAIPLTDDLACVEGMFLQCLTFQGIAGSKEMQLFLLKLLEYFVPIHICLQKSVISTTPSMSK